MSTILDERTLDELQLEWKRSITAHGRRPVSWADLDSILAVLLEEQIVLHKRIAAQDAEIAALKLRPDVHDAGIYREGSGYPKNALVTHRGYWLCLTPTTTVPGRSRDWRLVVKEHKAK